MALIMKLMWRIIKEPEASWVQLLRGKYLGQADFFDGAGKPGRKEIGWSIRNGAKVLFWKEPWLCDQPLAELITRIPIDEIDRKVNEYILSSGNWDWGKLEQILPHEFLLRLAAFKISYDVDEEDTLKWNHTSSGTFSTKSAYQMITSGEGNTIDPLLTALWK